ncbi:sugar 3,4-ketoisomerase [Fulvivirga ligni]|uniref:sugar 3,4-ketoisomerase n=1 Tax=Fulvivirga ligni TaxID=2904246 RepID=UPI001F292B91|nr:FdtA/QdtA family cupin domain-containing protein [Fulvivirga ligni]UII23068.1 FdtA/QdtA family cupin domain-containing protein [Fulvivirga ligni]
MEAQIIQLKTSVSKGGELSVIDEEQIPFQVKRSYWIYNLKEEAKRGGHAHINSDRVLVCLQGEAEIVLTNKDNKKARFILNNPGEALYFPCQHWIDMTCKQGSILMALTSCAFKDDLLETDLDNFLAS